MVDYHFDLCFLVTVINIPEPVDDFSNTSKDVANFTPKSGD
jgi:hypothetical protein